MRAASPVLAVGIVTCGRSRLTQRCLDSVRNYTKTPFQIFLVDNGSRDAATQACLQKWEQESDVTLTRLPDNRGPSAARNIIVDYAADQFAAFAMLDNDIIVCDEWDTAALAALDAGFDAVQPKLLQADGRTVDRGPTRSRQQPWLLHPEYLHRGAARFVADVSRRVAVPTCGGTAVIRSDVYRKTGRYDPQIWVGEDYEFALRAARNGCRFCYEPRCEMIHDHAFDPDYDSVRSDISRQLVSHLAIWDLHRKLLLSPQVLQLYLHLFVRGEPLFLTGIPKWSPSGIARRLERRLRQGLFRMRSSDVWESAADGEDTAEELRAALACNAFVEPAR
jgi:GT2 family glycosyltransferase